MKITTTNQLSKKEKHSIQKLISFCQKSDQTTYNFYLGEEMLPEDTFILLKKGHKIIGFLSVYALDCPEVSGLIAPKYRRNGYFSMLLEKIPFSDFIFYGHDDWPGLSGVALHSSFTNSYHECLMEFASTPTQKNNNIEFTIKGNTYLFFLNNQNIGHISIEEDINLINIYDVFINEEFRGKGYGKIALEIVLNNLICKKSRIILQVSEKNKPAYNLYLACGFKIISSVIYYSRFV